jgi:hypothetical protein
MTNFLEEQLTAGMRERVADVTITTDIVNEVLRVQRRRTVILRTAYTAGVVGLAGALTAGVVATSGTGSATGSNRPPVASAGSPELRLAAAVAASQSTSYRVKTTIDMRSDPGSRPTIVEGAFDPATTTGFLRVPVSNGARHEERLIGGDWYTGDAGIDGKMVWTHNPGKYTTLVYNAKSGLFAVVSADPRSQLDALEQSGARISQIGPEKYHFEAPLPVRKGLKSGTMTGDVTLGADQRVAKVVYQVRLHATVIGVTMELSDYGDPVTVERPGGPAKPVSGR